MTSTKGYAILSEGSQPLVASDKKPSLALVLRKDIPMLVHELGGVVTWRLDMAVDDIPSDLVQFTGEQPFADRVVEVLSDFRDGRVPLGDVRQDELEIVRLLSVAFGPRNKWEAWNMIVRGPARNSIGYVEFPYFWVGPRKAIVGVLLGIKKDGSVVLVRQYRHHLRRWTWEAPRGGCKVDESLESGALREGSEEAGILLTDTSQVISLGHYAPESGCLAYEAELFLATNVELGERRFQDGEAIDGVRLFQPAQIAAMASAGELDGYTEAIFSRALYRQMLSLS